MIIKKVLTEKCEQRSGSESQSNIPNSLFMNDFKKTKLRNMPRPEKLFLKFLSNEERRVRSPLKFSSFQVLSGETASFSNSVHSIEPSTSHLSLARRNPSRVFLAVRKDDEVELVIHSFNLVPRNLNRGKRIPKYDSIQGVFNSRLYESEVSWKSNSQGPSQGAKSAYCASVEKSLNREKQEKREGNGSIESIYARPVGLVNHFHSFFPAQSNQKWKIAS